MSKRVYNRDTLPPEGPCWYCQEPGTGDYLYTGAYKHSRSNWGYFCDSHWKAYRHIKALISGLHEVANRTDDCVCCGENALMMQNYQDMLRQFRKYTNVPAKSEAYF